MKIRNLESNDMDQSYKLLNELYDNQIEYDIFENKYNNSLSDNNFYGIVAEENGIILGVLISRVVNRLVKSKDILFIDDIIVNKDCRSNGIGSLLLRNAINFAKEQNCETIELKSYISNEKSHKLYEKIGFKKLHYAFKKIIVKK